MAATDFLLILSLVERLFQTQTPGSDPSTRFTSSGAWPEVAAGIWTNLLVLAKPSPTESSGFDSLLRLQLSLLYL